MIIFIFLKYQIIILTFSKNTSFLLMILTFTFKLLIKMVFVSQLKFIFSITYFKILFLKLAMSSQKF